MNDILSMLLGTNVDVWIFAKIVYVFAFVIYLIFSLVVLRQIQLMSETLDDTFNPIILVVGIGLVVVAAFGLVGAVLLL
jgi:hypothetical protein